MIIAGLPSGWEGFEASAALKVIVRRHNEGASNTIKLAKMMSFVEALYFEVGMMNGGVNRRDDSALIRNATRRLVTAESQPPRLA
jgi:hypothetical protein